MKTKGKKGVALISVLLVLLSLMVLTMGFAAYTTADHQVSQAYHSSNVTFYLAQAGLEYVQYLIKHNLLIYPYYKDVDQDGDFDEEDYLRPRDSSYNNQTQLYDAKKWDTDTTEDEVGDVINVYDTGGTEHLLISSLAYGSNVYRILDDTRCCGTFRLTCTESHDTGCSCGSASTCDNRVIYARSEGMIKVVPSTADLSDVDSWEYEDFEVKAKRTLIMRIPYCLNHSPITVSSSTPLPTEIISDGWFEKFR